MRSVAARPAETPLTVPASPPKTIAERGVLSRRNFAAIGVAIITRIALSTPVAMLNAITSELAPIAAPVTGPTMYVTAPAPMVVMLTASE